MTDASVPANADRVRVNAASLFAIGIGLGGLVILFGNADLKKGDNGGLGPAIGSAVILLALAAVLWYVVLPRVRNLDRTTIILSSVGILTVAVFWLGVTPLLATTALAATSGTDRLGKPATVLRALVVVAAVLTVVVSITESRLV